jgi:hypothetical protein
MRKRSVALVLITIILSYPTLAAAISDEQLKLLNSSVIEMCRGGTMTGSKTHIEARAKQSIITVKDDPMSKIGVDLILSTDEWNGLQVLINDPTQYNECVQYTMDLLVPMLSNKQNIDKDLNARITYIRSPIFCERLRYVIAQAPNKFDEWRKTTDNNDTWYVGPYLMGNPEALGMMHSKKMKGEGALVIKYHDDLYFYEPLVLIHQSKDAETGLVFNQVKKAIDECITYSAFYSVKNVSVRGHSYFLSNGTATWSFNKTGFLGFVLDTFDAFLANYEIKLVNARQISFRVYAPN